MMREDAEILIEGPEVLAVSIHPDMIAGIEMVMASDYYEPVELGERKRTDVLSVAEQIIEIADSYSKIKFINTWTKHERIPSFTLADAIGWSPRTSLFEGLVATVEDFRKRI